MQHLIKFYKYFNPLIEQIVLIPMHFIAVHCPSRRRCWIIKTYQTWRAQQSKFPDQWDMNVESRFTHSYSCWANAIKMKQWENLQANLHFVSKEMFFSRRCSEEIIVCLLTFCIVSANFVSADLIWLYQMRSVCRAKTKTYHEEWLQLSQRCENNIA